MSENKVMAVYCMSNFGGIEILDVINGIDDSIVYRFNFGTPEKKRHSRVYYTTAGKPYFKTRAGRVYLDECVRV